jgi:hypothetical protein
MIPNDFSYASCFMYTNFNYDFDDPTESIFTTLRHSLVKDIDGWNQLVNA